MTRWQHHRQARLTDSAFHGSITLENYMMRLESLAHEHSDNPEKQAIYAHFTNMPKTFDGRFRTP